MEERLQKILAAHGHGSRRKTEELITAGRVTVNGTVAQLGQKADQTSDNIRIDGKPLVGSGAFLYYLLYKPFGVVSTNIGRDTLPDALSQRINTMKVRGRGKSGKQQAESESGQGKSKKGQALTVRDLLPSELRGRVVSVGRLDKDSEGLLLLTNDGQLAQYLMHPKFEHEKEYEVTVDKPISSGALQQLKKGVMLDGAMTRQASVRKLRDRTFSLILREGRNRQIRRMCERIGYRVTSLKRVRIGTITDNILTPGQLRPLHHKELLELRRSIGI